MKIETDKKAIAELARKVRAQARLFEAAGEPGLAADIFQKAGDLYHAADKYTEGEACRIVGDRLAFESMDRVLRLVARCELEPLTREDLAAIVVEVPE